MEEIKPAAKVDKRGTPFYDIVDPTTGALLIRVGLYLDPVVNDPRGFSRLLDYLPVFLAEQAKGKWASFCLDSVSAAALSARKWHQYALNDGAKNGMQWYAGETDLLEELLCSQLPAFPCNTGAIMHVSKEKVEAEGAMVRAPLIRGRLHDMLASQWPELYRVYSETDKETGRKVRRFQTDSDERWQAGTVIEAPDGMKVVRGDGRLWEAVWGGWPAGAPRSPWHGIFYGEFHVGKSTAMAHFLPKPLYVAMFDARGKDVPYRRMGRVVE